MDPSENAIEQNLCLRRTMRDVVALSTLPAVWIGLGPDGILRSVADVLLNTIALDLVYIRLAGQTGASVVEVIRSRHLPSDPDHEAIRAALAPLLKADSSEASATIADLFPPELLHVAFTRFGSGNDQGVVVTGSRKTDFPTEQDRLLLGVAANQTAIVIERRRAEQRLHEQQEWLQVTLASIGDGVIATDTQGRITFLNSVAEELTGWTSSEAGGKLLETVFSILNEQTRQTVENPVMRVLMDGRMVGLANHTILISKDGIERPIDDSAAPIRDAEGSMIGVVLVFRDVTAQRRTEQYRNARLAVTEALGEGATLEEAACGVLRAVCENLSWDVGCLWIVNKEGTSLVCRESWHRPNVQVNEFMTDSCDRTFKRGEGLPGRVWSESKSKWILEVAHDANFSRAVFAAKVDLHSAFACPIIVGDQTLGVIEFLTKQLRQVDADLLEMMGTIAGNVGQFIERKSAEDELRRSERELADFFDNATIGLHWVGPDGIILKANQAELEMLGYNSKEYVGRRIADFHADEEVIGDILKRLFAGEKLVEYAARLRCKDGSIKDVLIDSSGLFQDGGFVHTRCFTRDVTERKLAEAVAREQVQRTRTILESITDAFWSVDREWRFVYVNHKAEELLGRKREDLLGKNFWEEFAPAVGTEFEHAYHRAVAENVAITFEAFYPPHDRWYEVHAYPSPDGLSVYFRDDSQRRHAEAALRESEEKLRLLADTIPQLAWMAQPDGHIFWFNRQWYEYTGKRPEQMEGWGWQSVHDPEVLPNVIERWKHSIVSGEPFEMVFPLKGADEQFRPYLTRVNPLRDEEGSILYWFGTNTDISDIKQMEEALRDADRRKDEFLAMLAHELRNPLAPLRSSLQILKLPHVDTATVQETRDMMERQVDHLVRLVDDLLDVSRVMRGKIDLRREPVELATVLARAVETVQPLIETKGHRLEISLPPESLLLDADPIRLTQILSNLITNAAKYTEANGHLWLIGSREEDQAVLRVRDNGIGIAPYMLPHVFELFVQVDQAASRSQGGLGVGLTLTKNLVEMHGGSVTAHSLGLGEGSEFVIRLPLPDQKNLIPQEKRKQVQRKDAHPTGYKLLVVDDNKDAAKTLAMLLRIKGHEVQVAHDGLSALEAAKTFLPTMIFLDIGMPGMDGYEVAQHLQQMPGLEQTVLAALTGWGQEEDRRRTEEAGFDHHLVKPLDGRQLEQLLADLKRLGR